uniref:Serine/arginine-rich splicing factor 3 n=3 Tax=Scophthalmus maximus TaxID=52904 RepID=A0A8D2ZDT9_SCOMX
MLFLEEHRKSRPHPFDLQAAESCIMQKNNDSVMHRDCPLDCKVYVGNLGNNGNKTELERSFGYYGPLRSVWVARNPPGFAFVEFEDPRDATDAVRELDGRTLCGCRVRVELSNGEKRSRTRGAPPSWSRRPRDRDDYRRRSSPPARRRSPRRRSFSRSRSRSFSRDRRRERSLSRDRNHKPSRSFSRSRSRSRSNDRK